MRPRLAALLGVGLALLGAGCAHAAAAGAEVEEAPAVVRVTPLRNEVLGFSVDLPRGWRHVPGGQGENVIARGQDGVLVRLFPEHFPAPPSLEACWERLHGRLPQDLVERPENPQQMAALAPAGLARHGGRRIHFAPFRREATCIVLVVEGPADGTRLDEVARLALSTFRLGEPNPAMQLRLAFDAATQLLEMGENAAALERFEEVLLSDPTLLRARLGAGLAAFFAGEATAPRAIEHLEKYLVLRADAETGRNSRVESDYLKDALMHLGLAYVAVKDFRKASERLGELVNRFPDDAVALYNFACALSLGGDHQEALYQLRAAVTLDPRLAQHARTDDDLVPLHRIPEYEQILTAAGAPPPESALHR